MDFHKFSNALAEENIDYLLDAMQDEIPVHFKKIILEKLLDTTEHSQIKNVIDRLSITEQQELEPLLGCVQVTPISGYGMVELFREKWQKLDFTDLQNLFDNIVEEGETINILTMIHTLINNCYQTEQKLALVDFIPHIYDFLVQNTRTAIQRDIIDTLCRIKSIQEQHITIALEKIDEISIANIDLAWDFLSYCKESVHTNYLPRIWDYIIRWLDTPPFAETTTIRTQTKYQIWACELILDSSDPLLMPIAIEFLLGIADNPKYSTYIRGDALDPLLRRNIDAKYVERINNVRTILGQTLNDIHNQRLFFREQGIEYIQERLFGDAIAGTIASDNQNVHISDINNAVKESIMNLLKDPEVKGNTIEKVITDITKEFSRLDRNVRKAIMTLDRFRKDPASFTERNVKLSGVLVLVWNRICQHAEKKELVNRLCDELIDAYGTCATGHLSRVVSVLVGYYPDIKQSVGYEKQLQDNILARIYTLVKDANDDLQGDLLIGMSDKFCPEYKIYVDYLEPHKDKIHQELFQEFVEEYLSADSFERIFVNTFPLI